ncbi:response regulator transcription factor [Paenibacillus chitinolyticus]|uniref:response regulator transcription factor n=2 Tax=Paenibacillus chitinolyticus TaxID=79263 RepID=UPI003671E981
MYRLLIADDEALEREGLEWMISRSMPGVFEVIHAENGRTAIQRAEQHRPDIVLMDIKMPGIEGLEALRRIKEIHPRMKLVLVTAYDYFSYAKQALEIGVRDYMLKPAKREQMIGLLTSLVQELEEEHVRREEELKTTEKLARLEPLAESELAMHLMRERTSETGESDLLELLDLPADPSGYALVLSFEEEEPHRVSGGPGLWGSGGENGDTASRKHMYDAVKSWCRTRYTCVVSPLMGRHLAVFVIRPGETEESEGSGRSSHSEPRGTSAEEGARVDGETAATAVTARTADSVGKADSGRDGGNGAGSSRYETAAANAVLADSGPDGAAVKARQGRSVPPAPSAEAAAEPAAAAGKLHGYVSGRLGRRVTVGAGRAHHGLTGLRRSYAEACAAAINADESAFVRVYDGEPAGDGPPILAGNAAAGHGVPGELELAAQRLLSEREERTTSVLKEAKDWIDGHFVEEITLEQAAERVHLSPHYFSKMFKRHMGATFIDYVTRLRIERAKELMRNEELSLKEVCFEVGYKDPNYFSRVFRKVTGISPTEYRGR